MMHKELRFRSRAGKMVTRDILMLTVLCPCLPVLFPDRLQGSFDPRAILSENVGIRGTKGLTLRLTASTTLWWTQCTTNLNHYVHCRLKSHRPPQNYILTTRHHGLAAWTTNRTILYICHPLFALRLPFRWPSTMGHNGWSTSRSSPKRIQPMFPSNLAQKLQHCHG